MEAWDASPVGLRVARERAAAQGLAIATLGVDLEGPLPTPAVPFDLVVVIDYLDRGLFGRLEPLLRPGGHLLLATFTEDHAGEHPSRRFRLARGELAGGLPGLATLLHEERQGRAGLLAERPAPPGPYTAAPPFPPRRSP